MSATFRSLAEAERALRVLKNAGYARVEVVANPEAIPGAPIVLAIDAAVTGAFRAAEILEEHGAEISYDSDPPRLQAAQPAVPPAKATFAIATLADRKPRVRKRTPTDVIIVTRGIESVAR